MAEFDLGFSLPPQQIDQTVLNQGNATVAAANQQMTDHLNQQTSQLYQQYQAYEQQNAGFLQRQQDNLTDKLQKSADKNYNYLTEQGIQLYQQAAEQGVQLDTPPNEEVSSPPTAQEQPQPQIPSTNATPPRTATIPEVAPYGLYQWTFLVNCQTQQAGAIMQQDEVRLPQLLSEGWHVINLHLPPNLLSAGEAEYMIHKHAKTFTDFCNQGGV